MNIPSPSRCAWLVAALALALPVHLPAQALDEALKNFKAAPVVNTSIRSGSDSTGNILREWDNAQNQLGNLDGYLGNNDYSNALSQARQYARNARTPEIRKLWDDLVIAIQTESKARDKAFSQKVDEVCIRSGKIALAAAKSAELDGLLDELYSLQEARSNNSGNWVQRSTFTRIDNTLSFINSWQDYLAQLESGDTTAARSTLRNLNSNNYRYRPIARSEVLKLAANLKTASDQDNLMDEATLDNLAVIRSRVATAYETNSNRRTNELSSLLNELDALSRAVSELKANRPVAPRELLRPYGSVSHAYQDAIQKLKDDYIIRALPRLSGIPDLAPAKPGETALIYVYRLVDKAVSSEDWPRAQRLATVAQDMVPNVSSCSLREPLVGTNPAAAIKAWLNAQRMEKASQPYAAADFYRQALAAGAPAKLEAQISVRLGELAVNFPDSTKLVR
ncbi:MAG: hypothetical protein WC205_07235 [Opitutaceae bacterium]|jgi:hypothetical protein